jgi:hypothetical protein
VGRGAAINELSPEEQRILEFLLSRLRCPKTHPADPGEPRVIVSGSDVRREPIKLDAAEVAKRTPPDPVDEARRRREELIARASKQDPKKLPHWDLRIWEFESRGIPAPTLFYEDAEFFREVMTDHVDGEARSPP